MPHNRLLWVKIPYLNTLNFRAPIYFHADALGRCNISHWRETEEGLVIQNQSPIKGPVLIGFLHIF